MPDPKSKKKVPKFVIAKNEAAAPGVTYLVHTQEPSFIGEIKKFVRGIERDEYIAINNDREFIEIGPLQFVEIKKYLTSNDFDNRRDYLRKAVKHWIVANHIRFDAFNDGALGTQELPIEE
ncbi:hypothetical protein SAMN04487996_12246 [Dyadobacter soli]|uniref:Uncharacterized protein n=1 Tax=Dyadobacter soli TaxID=659014 RepID=A0A1G7WJE7_9BACT|nr:hypothetical protein [Dyadobacter soli]SDG71320.1 hypothetical protein SAMN04487996_12246 [Dyadobacter soli]